jgi:hypothetical protein
MENIKRTSVQAAHKKSSPAENSKTFYGLLSLSALIAGMLIYLLFRDLNKMILFAWLPKPVFAGTALIRLEPSLFSNILRYNLPDMFWFLSAILLFRYIWFYRTKIQKAYIVCFYISGAAFEISQLSEKAPGTFDAPDLVFMGIGALVEGLLYNTFINRRLV